MEKASVEIALSNSTYARLQEGVMGGKSALNFLQEVKLILSSRDRWTKGAAARDAMGETVMAFSDYAVQFSLMGALDRVRPVNSPQWMHAARLVREAAGTDNLQEWNDRWWRTHGSVLRVIDRAMAEAV